MRRPRSDPGEQAPEPGRPTILSLQPRPVVTLVSYFRTATGFVTAITRRWRKGDSGRHGRCRLCPRCNAVGRICLIQVRGYVPGESADLFSTIGLSRQPRPPSGTPPSYPEPAAPRG